MFGVRQYQRNNWVSQPKRTQCTRAKQPLKEFCIVVKQISIEDLCLGVRHLPLEDLCVGVRQLPMVGCYSLELDNSQ